MQYHHMILAVVLVLVALWVGEKFQPLSKVGL